jgi:flagellar motor switch protein FliN/FliY
MAEDTATDEKVEQTDADQSPAVEAHEAELPEADDAGTKSGTGQIDILLDTTIAVVARLGQVEIPVRDLLQMGPGSVIQLDKEVGEPVDLFLRGTRFANGTLVVVGDRLGVRIKEIVSSASPEAEDANASAG